MKKNTKANNSFFYRYRKFIFFGFLFVISLSISLYFALASDDTDQNKITVDGIKISDITDGTGPWDTETGDGNDISGTNGIVRNFDSISYEVEFNLVAKEGQTINPSASRDVIVDFILPTAIEGNVVSGSSNSSSALTKVFDNYSYAEFTLSLTPGSNRIHFSLSDINASNNTVIKPIIAIKEATDNDKKSITDLSDEQRSSSYSSISSLLNKSEACNVSDNDSCEVSVTGISDYFINLYQGSTTKDDRVTNIPIGIMIGLRGRKIGEESKGKKGLLLPSEISFDVKALTTTENAANEIEYVENSVRSYKQTGLNYKVYIDSNNSYELPEITSDEDDIGNGRIEVLSSSDGEIKFNVTDIKNKIYPVDGTDNYYFSTNSFEILSTRTDTTLENGIGDIDINIRAYDNNKDYSNINVTDKYNRFVGTYESKVELYDSKDDIMDSKNKKPDGKAVFNYNEEFYVKSSFQYATTSGDGLDNLTNYIKFDNDALDLILNNEQLEYVIETGIIDQTKSAPYIDTAEGTGVVLYYGQWNTDYFERTAEADDFDCPYDISSKETLMNLFGGPCIQIKPTVKRTHFLGGALIEEDVAAGKAELTQEEISKGPLAVVSTYYPNSEYSDEYIYPTSTAKIKLKMQVKNDVRLINTAHQIVTSATGVFTEDDGNSYIYYLSNQNDHTAAYDLMNNPSNYTMTNYNFEQRSVTTDHSTLCGSLNCAVSGNTLLISAVRTAKPTVETFFNDVDTTNFYYYPMEFRIDANAYRSDITSTSFDQAFIDVYIPKYLRYISSEIVKDSSGAYEENSIVDKNPASITPVTYEGEEYNKLRYIFDSDDIVMGAIPKLKVFANIYLDTPKSANPVVFVTSDYTVNTTVVNPDSTITVSKYSSIDSDEDRTTYLNNLTIHNSSDVSTQGIVSSRYIERNASYSYNMQAFNNSSYTYENAGLYYVLPYKGDSSYSDLESKFEATDFKVKIEGDLPAGYKAYYTKGSSANIINSEITDSQSKGYSWVEWNDPTSEISEITAIKIEKTSNFAPDEYFGGQNGFKVTVTPVNSSVGDTFYNNFYIIADRPSGLSCSNGDVYCNDSLNTNKVYYSSSRDLVSIYNRIISGFVWEDYDYSGLYDNDESKLENIPVSLFKISDDLENPDSNDPSSFVGKEGEEWVADTLTDSNGRYTFRGLNEGKYYVKFTYDDKKYTVTKKGAGIAESVPGANSINSKSLAVANENFAVSSIANFGGDNNSSIQNMNLGLTIRKQFSIDIKKYISNVVVDSYNGTETYNYDNATTVTLNIRNPRDTTARVTYNFVVENTKYFPGYIGLISDYMPEGMMFNPDLRENQDWVLYGDTLYYMGLSGRLLIPNEKYYFSLVLDLNVEEGGDYLNLVSVSDLTLMGDELPSYDFNTLDIYDEDYEYDYDDDDPENGDDPGYGDDPDSSGGIDDEGGL